MAGTDLILGYRYCQVGVRYVTSSTYTYQWKAGVNTAVCRAGSPIYHQAPNPACECGFYAHHDLVEAINWQGDREAVMAVIGWGSICVHSDRFRSQYMQPLAILRDSSCSDRKQQTAAAALQVPLLDREQFEAYASEFGSPRYKHNLPPPALPERPWQNWTLSETEAMIRKLLLLDIYVEMGVLGKNNYWLGEQVLKLAGSGLVADELLRTLIPNSDWLECIEPILQEVESTTGLRLSTDNYRYLSGHLSVAVNHLKLVAESKKRTPVRPPAR